MYINRKVPTRFAIPTNAKDDYPLYDVSTNKIKTDSWFDMTGDTHTTIVTNTNEKVLRCKKIIITPDNRQLIIIKEWFDLYRYVYNETLLYIKNNKLGSFYNIRPIIKQSFNDNIKQRIAKCHVPSHTLDNAIHDVIKAYKSSFALHKGKKHFRIRYKKKKSLNTIVLEKSAFSKVKNQFSQYLGVIKSDHSLIGVDHDCKLMFKGDKLILYCPVDIEKKTCNGKVTICSLDPGIRTFQTVYCDDGSVYTFGNNVNTVINPMIDKINKSKNRKHKRRLIDKLKHRIEDLHWKTANSLCKLSTNILIGNMSTVGILRNNLTSKTKSIANYLSHYTFRQRLKAKCEEYNVEFMEVDESYTSKTCGWCGNLNNKLGSSKVFNCPSCGITVDRDINGARNIMIKGLS